MKKVMMKILIKSVYKVINTLMYREAGMALVLVLVFTTLLLVVGSAMLTFALTENEISSYHADDLKQHYLAEAGLEAALTMLSVNPFERESICVNLGDGHFRVHFEEPAAGVLIISSTGYLEDSSLTLKIKLNQHPEGTLEIDQWYKP